jgi:hypothetical protein
MALTDEEELELIELEIEERRRAKAPRSGGAGGSWASPTVSGARTSYLPQVNGRQIDTKQETPLRQLPGMLVDSGLEGGGATLGQALGAATGPFAPAAVPAFGAAGAVLGNAAGQGRRMMIGEQDKFSVGQALGAGPSGAIPGASLATAPARKVAIEAGKYALANTAGKAIEVGVDEKRVLSTQEAVKAAALAAAGAPANKMFAGKAPKESFNGLRDSRFKELRPEGFIVPPSSMGKGSDLIQSLGGKQAFEADAAIHNQPRVNKMAREDIQLEGAKYIKPGELKGQKAIAGAVYEEIQQIGDAAKMKKAAIEQRISNSGNEGGMEQEVLKATRQKELDELAVLSGADTTAFKQAQDDVRDLHTKLAMGTSEDARIKLREAEAKVARIREGISAAVAAAGKPELAKKFESARELYAKIIDVEDSTTRSSGFVDARKLGSKFEESEGALTGKLEKVGAFASAFKDEARDANIVSAPGVNKMSMNQSIQSAGRGTLAGMAAAAAGVAGKPIRKYYLSDFYQNYMARPEEAGPGLRAAMIKQILASQGRK